MRVFCNDVHEFDLEEDADGAALYYSHSNNWTTPGHETARITDDGNGLTIEVDGKSIDLDYDAAFKTLVLLMSNNKEPFKIVKEIIVAQANIVE